jgi:hypothetical protein
VKVTPEAKMSIGAAQIAASRVADRCQCAAGAPSIAKRISISGREVLSRCEAVNGVETRILGGMFLDALFLANQFVINLHKAFLAAGLDPDLDILIAMSQSVGLDVHYTIETLVSELSRQAELVESCVSYYYSDANLEASPTTPPLHALLPFLFRAICRLFALAGASLFDAFSLTVREHVCSTVDATSKDPSRSLSVELFRPVQMQTMCPFAANARIWGAGTYKRDASLLENIRSSVPGLTIFTSAARDEGLDGLIYAFPTASIGTDLESVSRLVKVFLTVLMACDPVDPRDFEEQRPEMPGWRFHFAGEDYFVNVFAPLYTGIDSRYTYGAGGDLYVFIFLQPESSFHLRIPQEQYQKVRDGIRSRFARSFQPYELDDLEPHRFILPPGDEDVVKWYN